MRIESFAPILGDAPRALVLGSMPSVTSLEKMEYYGHARNAFWPIMARLFDFDPQSPYNDRINALMQARVAVWDVLQSCERRGSLDQAIRSESELPNDLVGLCKRTPSLRHVFLNGRKAEQVWRRHFARVDLPTTTLPSTSPAMASLDLAAKTDAWQIVHDVVAGS